MLCQSLGGWNMEQKSQTTESLWERQGEYTEKNGWKL